MKALILTNISSASLRIGSMLWPPLALPVMVARIAFTKDTASVVGGEGGEWWWFCKRYGGKDVIGEILFILIVMEFEDY